MELLLLLLFPLIEVGGGEDVVVGDADEVVSGDVGSDVTLACRSGGRHDSNVLWVWDTPEGERDGGRFIKKKGGELTIVALKPSDARIYSCQDAGNNTPLRRVLVQVRTAPPDVTHLSAFPSSVFATLTWSVPDDAGATVTGFRIYYRRSKEDDDDDLSRKRNKSSFDWTAVNDIPADASSHTVYGLLPNSTYFFSVCAMNSLGCGRNVSVTAATESEETEGEGEGEAGRSKSVHRIWIAGVVASLVTSVVIFAVGATLLLIRNFGRSKRKGPCQWTAEEEAMELVPHITLNPSFNADMLEHHEPPAVAGEGAAAADVTVAGNNRRALTDTSVSVLR